MAQVAFNLCSKEAPAADIHADIHSSASLPTTIVAHRRKQVTGIRASGGRQAAHPPPRHQQNATLPEFRLNGRVNHSDLS